MLPARSTLWPLTLAAVVLCATSAQAADVRPARPLRLIVPAAPGGAVDIVARVVGERLGNALGQTVIVDNRAGGDGAIGLDIAAKAAPDGYTLVATSDSLTVIPLAHPGTAFDPRASFEPISLAATQPRVVSTHPSLPATSFGEFVALAKAKPNSIAYASGTPAHQLTAELIMKGAGMRLLHVPYKGGAPAIADLVGGHVPSAVTGISPVLTQARSGKLRMLAVTSAARFRLAADVPTLAESGLSGFDVYEWISFLAPAKTPRETVSRLNEQIAGALAQPAVRARLEGASLEARSSSPQETAALVREDQARWTKLINERGIRFDAK